MALRDRLAALLGVSAFSAPLAENETHLSLDSEVVAAIRRARGGNLSMVPQSRVRWYLSDLEAAERAADNGDLSLAAQLMRTARKDGVYAGVLSTRTDGLVRLPKRFRGNPDIVAVLEKGHEETRSVFDEMFPATELALLAADGIEIGVGLGEIVPVTGRSYGVMVRHNPEFLYYRWSSNQWFFRSIIGLLPITPGDGRWILHMPGGRQAPWQSAIWRAIARAVIRKEHAAFYRDNWTAKLANAARVGQAPQGSTQEQRQGFLDQLMAWGVNTVFTLTPGWEVKLLESNGRGYEGFRQTITDQNDEMKIAVAGQLVTTDGGAGFQNSDIHKSIRADLIKSTADGLAYTINTQGLPVFIIDHFGEAALDDGVVVEWDVTPPKDRTAEASAQQTAATAIELLSRVLAGHGLTLDVRKFCDDFGIPVATKEDSERAHASTRDVALAQVLDLAARSKLQPTKEAVRKLAASLGIELEEVPEGESQPRKIDLAPTDLAKVVKAREARASSGLPPFGDERDEKTVTELGEKAEAVAETEIVEAEAEAKREEGGKQ